MALQPNAGYGLLILVVYRSHTRRITVCRTPLDEWSVRRRDLYLTTNNNDNRQTSMPPVGFEPTISAGERPQTYALDRVATGTGITVYNKFSKIPQSTSVHRATRGQRSRVFFFFWVALHVSLCGKQHPKYERAIRLVNPPLFCNLHATPKNKIVPKTDL